MHFHFSFYSSLLLIFFSQGVIFSILLFRKSIRETDSANRWLAFFIFLCTLNILPWMLGHAGWYSVQPYRDVLFYLPLQHFFLLGPVIFFYIRSLLNPAFKPAVRDWLHFVPAAFYLLYSAVMFITDKLILNRYYSYADGHDRDLDTWYRLAGILSLSVYLIVSLRYYTIYKKLAAQVLSFADVLPFAWAKKFLVALLVMQACDVLFFSLYPGWGSFTSKWWYYFVFSVSFYYIALTAYANNRRPHFSFRSLPNRLSYFVSHSPVGLLPSTQAGASAETVIDVDVEETTANIQEEPELEQWKQKILMCVVERQAFKDSELTLTSLSKQIGLNGSLLSKAINKGFGMNFNDFINHYRIEAVKALLVAGECKRQTLLGIALDCGFNSKTTFNRAFKKHVSISPKEYLKALERNGSVGKLNVPNHDLERTAGWQSST